MTPYPVSNLPAAYGELPCLVEALGSVESRIFPVFTLNFFSSSGPVYVTPYRSPGTSYQFTGRPMYVSCISCNSA